MAIVIMMMIESRSSSRTLYSVSTQLSGTSSVRNCSKALYVKAFL